MPQDADGSSLDPCQTCPVLTNDRPPIIEQCQACQATVILKVQIGKGFTITGAGFAKGVSIEGTVWRPIVGPDTIGSVKAVWLDSNPMRAALSLINMARNMTGQVETG